MANLLKSQSGGVADWRVVQDARSISLFIVAWVGHDGQPYAETFIEAKDASDREYELKYIKGLPQVQFIEDCVDLGEVTPSFFVALSKDGKKAEGFFPTVEAAEKYCEDNFANEPGAPKNRKRDYNPLEVEIV